MEFFHVMERDADAPAPALVKRTKRILTPSVTRRFNEVSMAVRNSPDKDVQYIYKRYNDIKIDDTFFLWTMFDFDINKTHAFYADGLESELQLVELRGTGAGFVKTCLVRDAPRTYPRIVYNKQSEAIYSEMRAYDYCEREKRLFAHKMRVIAALFDILTPGGDFYITTTGFCEDSVVEMYCTLALMFNHITVYNSISVLCSGFASAITKEDVMRISAGGGTMGPATHTPKVTQLAAYLHANLRHQTQLFELLLAKKEEEFLQGVFSQNISAFGSMKPEALEHFMVQYNISLVENLRRVVVDGKIEKTSSAINGAEGRTILAVLAKYNLRKCVEVGLAHGVSAFYILSNPDTTLVSIDPYQNSQWRGRGVDLIRSFGFSARHKLHELKSYEALPRILVGKGEGSFDFVFIDGFHTFDYTLVDFFYSNLLLRIGGVIMIDDALHHGVAKCVRYIDSNYKHFRKLASSPTVAVFLKLREDTRDWDFHAGF